jgi:hypothetical protein
LEAGVAEASHMEEEAVLEGTGLLLVLFLEEIPQLKRLSV